MSKIEKLTHGAERDDDSVRIPANHPTFRFPRKEDQQATAPHPEGVYMLVSQLQPDQRLALGLPEEGAAEPLPEPTALAQDAQNGEAQGNAQETDGAGQQSQA